MNPLNNNIGVSSEIYMLTTYWVQDYWGMWIHVKLCDHRKWSTTWQLESEWKVFSYYSLRKLLRFSNCVDNIGKQHGFQGISNPVFCHILSRRFSRFVTNVFYLSVSSQISCRSFRFKNRNGFQSLWLVWAMVLINWVHNSSSIGAVKELKVSAGTILILQRWPRKLRK